MKAITIGVVGIYLSFLAVTVAAEAELVVFQGQPELFDMLQRINPLDEYRLNYPVQVRVYSDPGPFECEYQNSADVCRDKKLIFLLSEHEVNDFSKAFYSSNAYGWEMVSSRYTGGAVKISAKKRMFDKELNDWRFDDVDFLFNALTGSPLTE